MTLDRAGQILEDHGRHWVPSRLPNHIMGRVEWTHVDGTFGADWEDIPLSLQAIREWLGY